ncbi:DUF1800 domain-containing protein [Ponticoccus sp. SC2-23]|nr:DUF1800 domain-containing protein [Ponticoccus sp. SC6-9]MBM1224720.1 DUF1800 domain-containing protein [Ponticoccus sp. SC6-15]MBM1228233.1 DUF1800 domain-containing protein [Ponticoccus sp. SC6-38]MBM1234129.1 DUF1800 domain-containing protein [Ponticoccus sp. SC6-45]MBM1238735.1 DUF1800 domain-containing protein [Ponticoccus sp. SC6-49]MBM1242516.1 DUF1800 domain-containing protein [Ponticoccus sp. SC2-64]MBM1247653.1 DUF1800 domain-containing protein [Ponticoccus sp. SC6-42]MBM1251688
MVFSPDLADRRFGVGLSPRHGPPSDVQDMLSRLAGPDQMTGRFPIPLTDAVTPRVEELRALQRARAENDENEEAYRAGRQQMEAARLATFRAHLARGIETTDGFRERLTQFWGDHFTIRARNGLMRHYVTPYVEETIRPHVAGRFADMLRAAVTHPMMLIYLDQVRSVGPNSPVARDGRGLNENLAREVLELHTLGVDGPYGQADVRQLAELFTGLSWGADRGFWFRPRFAEPGAETVLGVTYGSEASLEPIHAVLDDLAAHPSTARHLATKLAVHFVADAPPPGLIDVMTAAYLASDGALLPVYEAMLRHPAAWTRGIEAGPGAAKVMQPFQFIQSALRGIGANGDDLIALDRPMTVRNLMRPLLYMGQDWERPDGPDGLPETAEAWITPQGMAARIDWAFRAPSALMGDLPDPRDAVRHLLGADAPRTVVFAAGAAEDRVEGIGVILTSAAFQRRD